MFCRILTYLENLPLYCLIYLLLKIQWPTVLSKNVFVYDFASIFNIDHVLLFYMRSVREQLTLSPQPSQTASSFKIPHINSLNHLEWLICFFLSLFSFSCGFHGPLSLIISVQHFDQQWPFTWCLGSVKYFHKVPGQCPEPSPHRTMKHRYTSLCLFSDCPIPHCCKNYH